jgi:hypothetical protein
LDKQAEKQAKADALVAAGGRLPGGKGHGFSPGGKPRLHSGYKNFEL